MLGLLRTAAAPVQRNERMGSRLAQKIFSCQTSLKRRGPNGSYVTVRSFPPARVCPASVRLNASASVQDLEDRLKAELRTDFDLEDRLKAELRTDFGWRLYLVILDSCKPCCRRVRPSHSRKIQKMLINVNKSQ